MNPFAATVSRWVTMWDRPTKTAVVASGLWMGRHWKGLTLAFVAGFAWVYTGTWMTPLLLIGLVLLMTRWRPKTRKGWWTQAVLSQALVDAGVLRMKGETLPSLSYKGKPVHDEHGTTVAVGLPQARGVEDVAPRRLAQALRIPVNRLTITQHEDDPANVIRVHVGVQQSKKPAAPPVADAIQTIWRDDIVIGRNSRGADVVMQTGARNTIAGGKPGMGKTSFGHMVLAHYLLDPSTIIHVMDGKGSRDDYAACAPLLDTYIELQRPDVVDALIGLLTTVGVEVDRRNGAGGNHPGTLLVLEEIQNVRSRAGGDRKRLAEIDRLMGEIIRLGRAVNVHILTLVQKPSSNDIPTGFRSQFTQGLAFKMHRADYRMVLDGAEPEVALPAREGQAIWCAEGEQEAMVCYYLDDAAWRKVCKRAATLRRPHLTLAPPPSTGLVDEVIKILRSDNDGRVSPTQLHAQLSPETRGMLSVRDLGHALGRHRELVEPCWNERGRAWRLVPDSVGKGAQG